jgi:hypothetical protein
VAELFLQSYVSCGQITFGCLNSKRQKFLVLVVGFSMTTGVVEVIIKLHLLRSEGDKDSPLMLQSFDFLTLYTKIDLMDLKSWMSSDK